MKLSSLPVRLLNFDTIWFYTLIICLSIFILGVQLGIKHGRNLEREDIQTYYGYEITN